MKNDGEILIEVVISLALFSILIFPLLDFTNKLFLVDVKLAEEREGFRNFQIVKRQLRGVDIDILSSGNSERILKEVAIPYQMSKNSKIYVETYESKISSDDSQARYMTVKLVYTINNKRFESEELVARLGD